MFANLASFWRSAALNVPVVIIGGGRWGRTWASVIAAARGSGNGVGIVARTDPDAVRAWVSARDDLTGLEVAADLAAAMENLPRPTVAIVASRPRDHVRDVLEAFRSGLHVLVEKPISVDARSGRLLVAAAQKAGCVLAVGTEFAYLPALHQLANALAGREARTVKLHLRWEDMPNEVRHGGTKVRHEEVGLLQDLLPHAFSIFQVLAPDRALRVIDASENPDGTQGWLALGDEQGSRYELACHVVAARRQRVLEIESDGLRAVLNFGGRVPSILIDGLLQPLDPQLAVMTSTLRLELGAFFSMTTGVIDETFIASRIADLLMLQVELERYTAGDND